MRRRGRKRWRSGRRRCSRRRSREPFDVTQDELLFIGLIALVRIARCEPYGFGALAVWCALFALTPRPQRHKEEKLCACRYNLHTAKREVQAISALTKACFEEGLAKHEDPIFRVAAYERSWSGTGRRA